MQSKGIIKWIALLLGVACIWQLSFTFVARNVEKAAAEHAEKMATEAVAEKKAAIEAEAAIIAKADLVKAAKAEIAIVLEEDASDEDKAAYDQAVAEYVEQHKAEYDKAVADYIAANWSEQDVYNAAYSKYERIYLEEKFKKKKSEFKKNR